MPCNASACLFKVSRPLGQAGDRSPGLYQAPFCPRKCASKPENARRNKHMIID